MRYKRVEYRASCTYVSHIAIHSDHRVPTAFPIIAEYSACAHIVCITGTYVLEYPPSQHGGSEVTFMVVSSVVFCEPQEEQKWGS